MVARNKLIRTGAFKKRSAKKKVAKKKVAKKKIARKKTVKRNPQNIKTVRGYMLGIKPKPAALKKGAGNIAAYWTGTGWDTLTSKAVFYPTLDGLKKEITHFKDLRLNNYDFFAEPSTRYVRGKIEGGQKRNPVPLSKRAKVKKAIDLFENFTGHNPEYVDNISLDVPDVALKIGTLDAVSYTTVRDGKTERYTHKFNAKSRPLLAVSFDGKQLLALSGAYKFTERGIEDTR